MGYITKGLFMLNRMLKMERVKRYINYTTSRHVFGNNSGFALLEKQYKSGKTHQVRIYYLVKGINVFITEINCCLV